MLTPAMALSKAIGRGKSDSIMYRPLPQREGLTEEVHTARQQSVRRPTDQFKQSAQRTGAENALPNIRIRALYVANSAMRDAMVKALLS